MILFLEIFKFSYVLQLNLKKYKKTVLIFGLVYFQTISFYAIYDFLLNLSFTKKGSVFMLK